MVASEERLLEIAEEQEREREESLSQFIAENRAAMMREYEQWMERNAYRRDSE